MNGCNCGLPSKLRDRRDGEVGPTRTRAVDRQANAEGVLRHVHQGSVLGWDT